MSPRRLFALIVLLAGCSQSPQHNFDQGITYFKAEQYAKAEACFARALSGHAPPTAQALNFLAVCQLQEGKTDAAIQNLQESLKLDPRHAAARYNLEQALHERALRGNPVPKAKPAIVAQPKPAEPKPVEAPKPVEVVKVEPPKQVEPVKPPVVTEPVQPPKVEPPPPPTVKRRLARGLQTLKAGNRTKAKAYFYEGIALQQQGKLPAAISSYTRAVATDPSYGQAYYNLAIAYRDSRQPEHALDNYEMALLANPDFNDARFNYAILLQQEGFTVDALAQYERILQDNPNDASVHLTLATLYSREHETKDKARQHYQAFLKLSPNSPLAREIRRWLEQNP